MSGSRYSSGPVTNRGLEHISNLRQGKPPSNEQTSDEIKANLALLALKDEQIKKCESDLAISKAETASHIEVNLNIKKGIQNGSIVIKDGNLVLVENKKNGGQRKPKSKKSKKSKKRKYKRSKHRDTKNIVRT